MGPSTNTAPSGSHTGAAGRVRLEEVRSRVRVSSAGTSEPEKPCLYCEPHVARDAVAQRLTWPHSTRLSVTDAVRRSPADCPHVRPLRSRISVRACGAGGSQYQHGSSGLSHAGSRPVVRLDSWARKKMCATALVFRRRGACGAVVERNRATGVWAAATRIFCGYRGSSGVERGL